MLALETGGFGVEKGVCAFEAVLLFSPAMMQLQGGCACVRDGRVCVRGGRVCYEGNRRKGALALEPGGFGIEKGVCAFKAVLLSRQP